MEIHLSVFVSKNRSVPWGYDDPAFILGIIFSVILVGAFISLCFFKQNQEELVFRCPLVPFVPCAGLFVNIFMMSSRSLVTYIAFLVWFVIGLSIYLLYGASHSKLGRMDEMK